jgi:hypothetical protein
VASRWVKANTKPIKINQKLLHNRLKQKQISELKNENMMTACTPEKGNNYLL